MFFVVEQIWHNKILVVHHHLRFRLAHPSQELRLCLRGGFESRDGSSPMSQQQCWEHGLGGDKGWEHNNSCFFWWSPSLNDTRWVQAEVPRGGGHGFPEPGRAQCDLPLRWWQGLPDQSQQDPFGRIGQRKPTTTLLILWRTMDQRFLEGWQLKVCHIWNTNTQGPLFFCWCLILVLLVRWCIFLVTKPFCSQLAGKGLSVKASKREQGGGISIGKCWFYGLFGCDWHVVCSCKTFW